MGLLFFLAARQFVKMLPSLSIDFGGERFFDVYKYLPCISLKKVHYYEFVGGKIGYM